MTESILISINVLDKKLKVTKTVFFNSSNDKHGINIFSFDNIFELQKKIYPVINVPIFLQHICTCNDITLDKPIFTPLNYSIQLFNSSLNINISDILNITSSSYSNININTVYYENKNNLQIFDNTSTLVSEVMEDYGKKNTLDLYVIDMNIFINKDLENINQSIYQELYYYGCAVIYWPMLSFDAFVMWLTDQNLFSMSYPMLLFNKKAVEVEIKNQIELFKNMAYNSYDINNIKINNPNVLIHIKTLTYETKYKLSNINTRILFEYVKISDMVVAVILMNTSYNGKYINIIKTDKKNVINVKSFINKCNNAFNNTESNEKINEENCLFIMFDHILLLITNNNTIKINYTVNGENIINLQKIFELVLKYVNPYLKLLSLHELTKSAIIISNLSLSMDWNIEVSSIDIFSCITNLLEQFCRINSMKNVVSSTDQLKFILFTGIKDLPNLLPFNQFSHLFDLKSNIYWNKSVHVGQYLIFNYIFKYVRINLPQINIKNINMLFSFIDFITMNLLSNKELTKFKKNKKINIPLKLIDPALYSLGKDKLYSRICQKKHQPEVSFTQQPNYIKYWNHTTNSPIYYVCPNPKYSHFSFITGVHDKNYCIPCCNKNIKKDRTVFNTCIKTHAFYENKDINTISRYITNFGKAIEPNRLGNLPKDLSQYFVKKNNEIIREISLENYFIYEDNYYEVEHYLTLQPRMIENKKLSFLLKKFSFQYKTYYDILQVYLTNLDKKDYFISFIKKIGYQPLIMVVNDNGKYELLWHRFMLLKYFLNKHEDIPCIIVSVGGSSKGKLIPVEGKTIPERKQPDTHDLYIYGVQQFYNEINISALYILAMVMEGAEIQNGVPGSVPVQELIMDIIKRLNSNRLVLNKLNTEYRIDLIQELTNISFNNMSQINWNMIFIEIIELLYEIKVFLFYMKNNNLTLHYLSSTIYKVNLIIYRLDVNNYYPIYEFNLTDFFKKGEIKTLLFETEHYLVETIYKMVDYLKKGNFSSLFFTFLKNKNIKILKYFRNKKNLIYMLLLEYHNGKNILFPINNQFPIELSMYKFDTLYTRDMATITYKELIEFLHELQGYLIENEYYLDRYEEDKKIIYKDRQIGITCTTGGMYFYHVPIDIKRIDADAKPPLMLKYDTDYINKMIFNANTAVANTTSVDNGNAITETNILEDLYYYYYKFNLYHLFSLQILSKLDLINDDLSVKDDLINKADFAKYFYITETEISIKTFPNILLSCNECDANKTISGDISYCKNNKLIISKEDFDKFYTIFSDNIYNPNKKMYYKTIKDNIVINNFFKFSTTSNENISIVVNE